MDWNRRSYTIEEFTTAWMEADSIKDCARAIGLVPRGGTYKSLKLAAKDLGLNTEHMSRTQALRGRPLNQRGMPLEDILVKGSTYSSTSQLRKRLIKEGLLAPKCSAPHCPVSDPSVDPWTGQTTEVSVLTLDHINGDNTDNRLENLRILCPYCHTHTTTFCAKNRKKYYNCISCGNKVSKKTIEFCKKCHTEKNSKFTSLSIDEIILGVKTHGYLKYSKMIGVSDNGIRKYLKRNGVDPLPRRQPLM